MSIMLMAVMLAFIVSACAPTRSASVERLPTVAPSPTAPVDMMSAQQRAMEFFDAWTRFDMPAMHRLTTFASQEATPLSNFQALYDDAHNLMTLETVTITPRTMLREADRMVALSYDITFETDVLGTFTEENRTLRLIIDPASNDWRVAWSVADIFPEMSNGAVLRFEARVPSRANIYDRNGTVLADQNGVAVRINVIKDDMPDQTACATLLADVLDRDLTFVQDLFNRSGSNWVIDVGAIEAPRYDAYNAQLEQVCNATYTRQAIRRYPRGSLAPHILGNVGYPDPDEVTDLVRAGFNQETIIGKSGVERTWDETLRGSPGGRLVLVAPNGQRIRTLAEVNTVIPESIWLTLDADLQEYTLRSLGEAYADNSEGWGRVSDGAAAVVMNVNNGEVLAMASWPSYDGNALNPFPAIGREVANLILEDLENNPRNPQLNRAALGTYPAGSTMKVVPAVAVLDSGIYGLDHTYVSTGEWQFENDRRFDWLAGGHGRVDIGAALTHSCNSCFYQAGFDMNAIDPNILPNYALRMGLGAVTGIGDIAESPGTIPSPEWLSTNRLSSWTYSDAVNMAIGQGDVQVTPLQMARMYGAIANGGTLYQPHLVRETGILDQRSFVADVTPNGVFDFRPEVMSQVRRGLCDVIDKSYGTASHIFRNSPLLDIGVCGKTGTATAGALGDAPHSWFVAWAPRDNPEIIVAVMLENAGDGSAVAAPITRRIMEYYFFGPF
jgi:penicillin-binding protein 2